MKKIISFILTISILFSFYGIAIPIKAFTNTSIEQFAEEMSELYAEEVAEGKELEDSVVCRVIVKATSKPDTYKNAECVVGNNNLYIYQYSDAETAQKAVEYYNSLPYVKWAELDGVVEGQASSYGNGMIQGDEAKEYIRNKDIFQENVIVAVLDTGVNFDLEGLEHRLIDSNINLSGTGLENSALADNDHGNHVAWIIADNTTENVIIKAYKVLDCDGKGTLSSIGFGILEAVNDGVDIINLSLTTDIDSKMIRSAIETALDADIPVVCAAGNSNDNVSKYYPAAYEDVFTVGSIDQNGNRSFFSNYGEEIDFVAPGHFIEVSYEQIDYGTSFAAPFVTAATAMIKSVKPDSTVSEIEQILESSCIPYSELSYHDGLHPISDYDIDLAYDYNLTDYFLTGYTEDEELYYGYGMPQISNAIAMLTVQNDIETPTINAESKLYNDVVEVTITVPEGYDVYFTSDESFPSAQNGTHYTEPLKISSSQSLRAVAYSPNGFRSNPVSCETEIAFVADESDFEIDSNGNITAYNGSLKEFVVPNKINNVVVTGVADSAFGQNENIESIIFPKSVTSIGKSSFKRSTIRSISGEGIETIGNSAFQYCENLIYVNIPELKSIGNLSFSSCQLRTVDFPKLESAGNYAFQFNRTLASVSLPTLAEVPLGMFYNCQMLRSVKLDSALTADVQSFCNCYWLKIFEAPLLENFVITRSQNTNYTFKNCLNLTEISLSNVKTISKGCFSLCTNLKSTNFPNAIEIGNIAFSDCISLSDIILPNVQTVNYRAFAGTYALKELTLESVTAIQDEVFQNSSIKRLYAPKLNSVGSYVFSNYNNMYYEYAVNTDFEYLYAPNLETASDFAFAYTGTLYKLELPSLTDLGEDAFLESSVAYFDAPVLKNASSLPTAENSIAILSSEFSECSLDATDYSLTIYGTPETYAQTYAEQYGLTFIPAPAIINDLPSEYFEGSLAFDVAGFNKTYQWYGTNNTSSTGTQISGAKNIKFVPSGHNYKYFYCVVSSDDNGYTGTVKTSLCQNMLYSPSSSSNARITIATPSNRYLKYGESINLYANATGLPEGAKIKWRIVEGSGVTLDASVSGKICTVTSKSNGNVIIEAYAVNKYGNTILNEKGNRIYDREGITSEVSLWWIILYYIRQMFSITNSAVSMIS